MRSKSLRGGLSALVAGALISTSGCQVPINPRTGQPYGEVFLGEAGKVMNALSSAGLGPILGANANIQPAQGNVNGAIALNAAAGIANNNFEMRQTEAGRPVVNVNYSGQNIESVNLRESRSAEELVVLKFEVIDGDVAKVPRVFYSEAAEKGFNEGNPPKWDRLSNSDYKKLKEDERHYGRGFMLVNWTDVDRNGSINYDSGEVRFQPSSQFGPDSSILLTVNPVKYGNRGV